MLRNIQALTKSAGASILAYPCNLFNLDGVLVTGTGPLFLQLFDKVSAPVANDVPVECYEITTTGPFPLASIWQAKWPIPFTLGLAVGISSVDFKYTAATAAYSVSGQIEEGTQSTDGITGLTTLGDITTGLNELDVWSSGTSNFTKLRLFRIRAVNLTGSTRYMMLFGNVAVNVGDRPLVSRTLLANATATLYFGPDGFHPRQILGGASNEECVIFCSTTATGLTLAGATDMACEVQYKIVTN